MSSEIIRKLASRVLRAEIAARNVRDVNTVIDTISTRIRFDDAGEIYVVTKDGQRDHTASFDSFMDEVKVNRPDLFKGAGSPNTGGNKNPFMKGSSFSITNQMFLIKSNPELAEEYKAEAEAAK